MADPLWRLNNLYQVIDENGHKVRFELNWAQAELFEEMHYLNLILKARQLGFTTFIQLFMLDACLFNSNIRAGTIAHTQADAQAFFRDKAKFPYDNLPEAIKAMRPVNTDSAMQLSFDNNSVLVVGTSLRSGTYQYVHVSEFGKISAQRPDKAREIRTGTFNTVHAGNIMFVESTAEGQDGDFFKMCETAQAAQRMGAELTPLDFKFFFFPWWREPKYRLPAANTPITTAERKYFDKLRLEEKITLDAEQQAWYVKKARQQLDDMKREFPSTPKEAFEAAVDGAYYSMLMALAESEGRIAPLPIESGVAVETWWDLGMDDAMTIGFVQRIGAWINIFDYYENSGEGLGHYAGILQERQQKHKLVYSEHFWPHDGNVRILDEKGRKRTEVMRDLGYKIKVVERAQVQTGIQAVRDTLPKTRIDSQRCEPLIKAMKNYRKLWDDKRGVFDDKPHHNWASHAADMMRTGAMAQSSSRHGPRKPLKYPGDDNKMRVYI